MAGGYDRRDRSIRSKRTVPTSQLLRSLLHRRTHRRVCNVCPEDRDDGGKDQTTLRHRQYRPDRQERHALDQSRQASRGILLSVRQFRPIGFFRIYRVGRSKASVHLFNKVRDLRAGQLRILLLIDLIDLKSV